jgi:hypothetical protein
MKLFTTVIVILVVSLALTACMQKAAPATEKEAAIAQEQGASQISAELDNTIIQDNTTVEIGEMI